MKVLIVDDEAIVRAGLKNIIEWESLGFTVCGEGETGIDGYHKILEMNPDLVLLDIKMPGMYGIDIVREVRQKGFKGRIIILTGFSDYKFMNDVMKYGVDDYLLKPIDEVELLEAVKKSKNTLVKSEGDTCEGRCRCFVKNQAIRDMIMGKSDLLSEDEFEKFGLLQDYRDYSAYQIVVIETSSQFYEKNLKLLIQKEISTTANTIELFTIEGKFVLLVPGGNAALKISALSQSITKQRISEDFNMFFGIGRSVSKFQNISQSYQDACAIIARKFFYQDKFIFVSWDQIETDRIRAESLAFVNLGDSAQRLLTLVISGDIDGIDETLRELKLIYRSIDSTPEKVMEELINLLIQIKRQLQAGYFHLKFRFPSDITIMKSIYEKNNLDRIIEYLYEELCSIANGFDYSGREVL